MTPGFMASILRAEAAAERRLLHQAAATAFDKSASRALRTKALLAQVQINADMHSEREQQRAILRGLGYVPAF